MNERKQQRKVRHRLAVVRHAAEVTGNVSATCRYFGISRPTFYKWLNRFDEVGEDGLRDGSVRRRSFGQMFDQRSPNPGRFSLALGRALHRGESGEVVGYGLKGTVAAVHEDET